MLRSQPIWVTQLCHSYNCKLFAKQIEQVASLLKIESDGQRNQVATQAPVRHPASREQVRALISLFLDEDPDRAVSLKALCAQRAFIDEWTSAACEGDFWKYCWNNRYPDGRFQRIQCWWITPRIKAYAAAEMDRYTALIDAARTSDSAVARAMAFTKRQSFKTSTGVYPVDYLETLMGYAYLIHEWRPIPSNVIHDRRQAAVFLAALLYQIDHDSLPTTASQLAPEYLNPLPIDPITNSPTTWKLLPLPSSPIGVTPSSRPTKK